LNSDNVHELPGPVLVLAGPGTGKTQRLAKRIKYLVEAHHAQPDEITVVTFTAAAAQNMRNRLSDGSKPDLYVPHPSQPKLICTLHSLAHRVICENSRVSGVTSAPRVIADDWLRSILIGDAAQLAGYQRDSGEQTAECRQFGDCRPSPSESKCEICHTYRHILRLCSAVDHDEQLLLAYQILKNNPDVLAKYRALTRHLLVDEYQDINAAQFELIRLLSDGQRDGLFVVGDDDQSIYSWRGGSPEYIRRFRDDFSPDARVVPLSESFRCHRHVLEGAIAVVERFDRGRLPKGPFQYKIADGPKIVIHNAPSDAKEAKLVRRIVEDALPSRDVLVLFPTRLFLRAIAQEVRAAQIPFSAPLSLPGTGLPLVSVLGAWLADPSDSLSFRRCLEAFLHSPAAGLPSSKVSNTDKVQQREAAFRVISSLWQMLLDGRVPSLWDALIRAKHTHEVTRSAWTAFSRLLELYVSEGDVEPFTAEVSKVLSPWRKIPHFLEEAASWVELASQGHGSGQAASVRLMTFQGAKGLEAEVVCVIGLEDGVIQRGGADIAEQARLLYVSMTRAIDELHLFHARKRSGGVVLRDQYKSGAPDTSRSRFLDAIPAEHSEIRFHPS